MKTNHLCLLIAILTALATATLFTDYPVDIVGGREYEGHYVATQPGVFHLTLRLLSTTSRGGRVG